VTQFLLALVFLTRLPVRLGGEAGPLAAAMRWFPLVGAGIGAFVALIYWAAHSWLPVGPAALLALAAGMLLTGALHEDGLADCADGFGGGNSRDDKLRIMKDSAIGSYGALALIMSVALRAGAIAAIEDDRSVLKALVATHAVARAVLPVAMVLLPPASDSGVAAAAGRPGWTDIGLAVFTALAVAAVLVPQVLLGLVAVIAFLWLVKRQLGGYTGDVLGAAEQVAETAALLAVLP